MSPIVLENLLLQLDPQVVWETLTLRSGYNSTVVIVGTTLLGISAGVVGVFALLRKRSLMADALSHATLPGIGLAFIIATWLGYEGRSLPILLTGAAITGVLGVVTIQWLVRSTRLREDAAIGIVLSVFFGIGVVILSIVQSMKAGTAGGINHFIYGQTAAMSAADAKLMGLIALATVFFAFFLLKEFAVVCFNDAFAQVTGWPVSKIDLLMMALVALVTVAGLQAVGLILVVAMLIIPAVAARFWTERLWKLILLAGLIGGVSGYLGSVASALLPRKPAGAVIVLTAGMIFTLSMFIAPSRGVLASVLRRMRLKLRIATDHLLEATVDEDESTRGSLSVANTKVLQKKRNWGAWLHFAVPLFVRVKGFGRFEKGAFLASEVGLQRGLRVERNHQLWEQYLLSYADIAPGHIDWTVDQVEHVLSPELINELEILIQERTGESFEIASRGGIA